MLDSFEKHLALNKFRIKAEDIDEIEAMLDLCREFIREHDPDSVQQSNGLSKKNLDDMTPDELINAWTEKVISGQKYSNTPPPPWQNASYSIPGQGGVGVLVHGAGGSGYASANPSQSHQLTNRAPPTLESIMATKDVVIHDRWSQYSGDAAISLERTKQEVADEIKKEIIRQGLIHYSGWKDPNSQKTSVTGTIRIVKP